MTLIKHMLRESWDWRPTRAHYIDLFP